MPIMVLSIFAVGSALTHSFSFPHFSLPSEHQQLWEERWRRTHTVPGAGWVLLGCIQEFSASWQRSASAFCFSSWRTVAALPHFDGEKSKLSVLAKAEGCSWKRLIFAVYLLFPCCSPLPHHISASWGLGMWVISWLIHGRAPARRTELLQLEVQSYISWVVVCTTLQAVSSALGGCS